MLSIQNISIRSTDNQLTVSVKVNSVANLSEHLRLLSFNLRGFKWVSLAPSEPVLEFPIDPSASRYYFERTFGVLSVLYTNMFLDAKIWSQIEPKIRAINFNELASANAEHNLYTAPIVTETQQQGETAKENSVNIDFDDQANLKTQIKITGATAGKVEVNFGPGKNSIFFKGVQGNNVTITEDINPVDWRSLRFGSNTQDD